MITPELAKVIDDVLREELADIGYVSAEIVEDVDHDGDDILRVIIAYKKVGDSVDPTPTFLVTSKLRKAMRAIGEYRFPHLRHLFPEDQDLKVA